MAATHGSTYTIDKTLETDDFDDVVRRTRAALADAGFGVLTEIDVKATMKAKLSAEMADYLILGACNPRLAYRALALEPKVGAMLPCNVIVRRCGPREIAVSAVDPVASMAAIPNAELASAASDVRDLLAKAIAAV